jgi:hypothetical protein
MHNFKPFTPNTGRNSWLNNFSVIFLILQYHHCNRHIENKRQLDDDDYEDECYDFRDELFNFEQILGMS